jgi:hypothetical protein
MKKILIVVPLLMSVVFAQNPNTKNSEPEKKSGFSDQPAANALDGKAYKVTFKAMSEEDKLTSSDKQYNQNEPAKTVLESPVEKNSGKSRDYSSTDQPLANTHALLKFENGSVKSSTLDKEAMNECAYHITASGSDELYSFTSFCMNNPGTSVNKPDNIIQKEKPEKTLIPDNSTVQTEIGEPKTDRNMSDVKSDHPVAGTNETEINRVNSHGISGRSASISGVINGNSITGTLVCWMENGKSIRYSFTGSRASQKEIRSEGNPSSKGIQ